ncbi:PepSY domain-containing protein [Bradyrhizobium sp. JYMT SZCCT0180]|uniref:PepSY domain-containing protein n=1 Tax=Bradyrhizobium sp. JYMT SZCCT0180 TaxID=2807666 RepID=UPI001BA6818A|nr:PepSY domain-containing protein [Bradyrhizobium sp. JYMT SZCCT0180]MBR1215683.1 PepSY domain-containing protein [Bradyrhizobium sp. JYMT SZCCT0180]
MKRVLQMALVIGSFAPSYEAAATGLATCNSGPQSGWQSEESLSKKLIDQGWKIRRIKIDGGCYEVYAINEKGQRVESYFHPVTFEPVLTSVR